MIPALERRQAIDQTLSIFEGSKARETARPIHKPKAAETIKNNDVSKKGLSLLLLQANVPVSRTLILCVSLLLGATTCFVFSKVLANFLLPFYFAAGASIPFLWLETRARNRANEFSADYPAVLLAAASSIKVGLTPYEALERATRLLPKQSLVRTEVDALLRNLHSGMAREQAVRRFGASIRQPDLELFRSAFLLVLESGGRFSPTLQRLATVSNNRATLIRSAIVSTANMRMTANVLLAVTPILLLIVAARTPDFWELFRFHPIANAVGSAGVLIITACYGILRHMSNFKP